MLVGGDGASAVQAYRDDNLIPRLVDEDPLQVGNIWQKMYDADRGIRKKGIPVYGTSMIDIGHGVHSECAADRVVGQSARRPVA